MPKHNLQERYSQLVDARLRQELVSQYMFNARYEGKPTAGAVNIPVRGEVKVNEYDRAKGIALDEGATTYVKLTDFKDLAVNEIIDGYEADALPDNVVADRLASAAYSMALKIDTLAFAELETRGTELELKGKTAYEQLVEASTALTNNNVPRDGRVVAVTPEFEAELLLDDRFIRQGDLSQELRMTGAIGQAAGFTVHSTNNITKEGVKFIANHPEWAAQVKEWAKDVYIADLSDSSRYIGASAIKGRTVVGHKVTQPKTVILGKAGVVTK